MCGIFACHCHPDVQKFKPTALRMAKQWELFGKEYQSVEFQPGDIYWLINQQSLLMSD
ncbi:MAG: hypothetical protein Q9227_005906 [Pyrenula ochraceoflavens]